MIAFTFYVLYYVGLFSLPMFIYFLFIKEKIRNNTGTESYHPIKRFFAQRAIKTYQDKCKSSIETESTEGIEKPKLLCGQEGDTQFIYGTDLQDNVIFLKLTLLEGRTAEVEIYLKILNKVYVLPNKSSTVLCSVHSSKEWNAGNLHISVVEPLRRLRITYSGFLKDISTKEANVEHVRFNFIWNAAGKPLYFPQDYNSKAIADDLAREKWKDSEWLSLIGNQIGYEQYGALIGFVTGSKISEEISFHIPSFRKRQWGIADNWALEKGITLYVTAQDGTLFCIGAKFVKNGCQNLRYGTIYLSTGMISTIDESDICIKYCEEYEILPKVMTIDFKASKVDYKCIIHLNPDSYTLFQNEDSYGWIRKQVLVKCIVNGENARGILHFWRQKLGKEIEIPKFLKGRKIQSVPNSFVLPLSDNTCTAASLAGGKGSSLALLTLIDTNDFVVPKGFVILSQAFKYCIENNSMLKDALMKLNGICTGKKNTIIDACCERIVDLITNISIPDMIVAEILQNINSLKDDTLNWGWAVRSSGITEDSEEFSSAGQNATFLGCRTNKQILEAVCKCWASLYSSQSVQYRKYHSLPIITDIAVVIQKMVPSDCSGVLFTCHPSTSDVSQMIITSNYGLGESVVSGKVDPDTFVLLKSWDGKVKLLIKQFGLKKMQITLSNTNEGVEMKKNENATNKWSLTDEQVIVLGNIGFKLEQIFGSPRDIEWSFYKGKLYLLQSRPVTSLNAWTDFELTHEFDTPVLSQESVYTKANIGEVQPGAMSVMSQHLVTVAIDKSFQKLTLDKISDPFFFKSFAITHHNVVIDVLNSLLMKTKNEMDVSIKVLELAILGHPIIDEKIHNTAKKRFGVTETYQQLPAIMKMMKNTNNITKNAEYIAKSFQLNLQEADTSQEMYNKIKTALTTLEEVTLAHCEVSRNAIFYQTIALSILVRDTTEFTSGHYYDISLILSTTSNVLSAEIPKYLEEIAYTLQKENLAQEFLSVYPKDGLEWLEKMSPKSFKLIKKFFKVHGHRVFKEFELAEPSWEDKPFQIISMIQSNCKSQNNPKHKENMTVDELVSKFVTVDSLLKKKLLKYFIQKCRTAITNREQTKSELIRVINKLKIGLRKLAQNLVKEGILPNENLIFHLTPYETEKVINRENIHLIKKALRRYKLYSEWNSLKFPEVMIGVPKPLTESKTHLQSPDAGTISLKGTPVFPGKVIARACVINSLDNIDQLNNGDILITNSTDIGWSPYFPMLAGVVTELGGLISHGAVVAREYGLPCIVGVKNATRVFKTGDKVLMLGNDGILQLLD